MKRRAFIRLLFGNNMFQFRIVPMALGVSFGLFIQSELPGQWFAGKSLTFRQAIPKIRTKRSVCTVFADRLRWNDFTNR